MSKCNWCNKEKKGKVTGICEHCGRFGFVKKFDNIKYDVAVEVTSTQYEHIMTQLRGSCAGLEKGGKFYIKLWYIRNKKDVLKALNTIK